MNKFSLVAIAALCFSLNAFADSWIGNLHLQSEAVPPGVTLQKLVDLTSDQNGNSNYLNLMIDSNGLAAGMYNEANPKNSPPADGGRAQNVFWLRDIESPAGVVLAEARGRKALLMKGELNRESQEGIFTIKYLANGLTMKYESCNFSLKKAGKQWWVKNAYSGEKVNKIHVITWSMGITTLEGICPKKL